MSSKVARKSKVVEVPVVEAPVVEEPVVEVPVVETPEESGPSFRERLDVLIKSRSESITSLKEEIVELKKLQKEHDLLIKLASKKKKKAAPNPDAPKRKLTGFAAPCKVSDDLHQFLGTSQDTLVSGTSVSAFMHKYLKEHNLQNPEHTKEFVPDAALLKLLSPSDTPRNKEEPESPLVYFSFQIQRYIKQHYLRE